ncbi:FG-GAP repeat domain-containing protein [Methylobacterium aquaticum]|uniref:FG-GAP repeat domain-containing protein n=1 Tax=Methylobacterium aquaticum TaxID=270351 RepID=UPI000A953B6D|nr:VCBS repeat-containing protein [Methylobacterium aquaticum]
MNDSIATAIDLGSFGSLRGSEFPSYYMNNLSFSSSPPQGLQGYYYKFTTDSNATDIRLYTFMENPSASTYISLYDSDGKFLTDNRSSDPISPPIDYTTGQTILPGGIFTAKTFYLSVKSVKYPASTNWGLYAYSNYQDIDRAGDTAADAKNLGTFTGSQIPTINGTLVTAYGRKEPAPGSADAASHELTIDFNTALAKDPVDFYKFNTTTEGDIRFNIKGKNGGVVLSGPAQGSIGMPLKQLVSGTSSVHIIPGTYYIQVHDDATQGAGSQAVFHYENREVSDTYSINVDFTPSLIPPVTPPPATTPPATSPSTPTTPPTSPTLPSTPVRHVAADFDGNGTSDLLWRSTTGNINQWLFHSQPSANPASPLDARNVILGAPNLGNISSEWTVQGIGDLNGDGTSDILWRDAAGHINEWLLGPDGRVALAPNIGTIGSDWSVQGVGDLNGDGQSDILWRDRSGNINAWNLDRTGHVADAPNLGKVGTEWTVKDVADVNGDGVSDILWQDTAGHVNEWLLGKDGRVSSAPNIGVVGPEWTLIGTGDFNGDGTSDLLWRHTAGYINEWLMGTNGRVASSPNIGAIAADWSLMSTGDYNGDGRSDLMWRDTSGHVNEWLLNSNGQVASAPNVGTIGGNWASVS